MSYPDTNLRADTLDHSLWRHARWMATFPGMPRAGEFRDLSGQRFGQLTVLSTTGLGGTPPRRRWLCQCDCGSAPLDVIGESLTGGRTKSCGCLRHASGSARLKIRATEGVREVVRAYEGGASADELAQRFGVSRPTILDTLRRAGTEIRPALSPLAFSPELRAAIVGAYAAGASAPTIADAHGTWSKSVLRVVRRAGVEPRSLSEAMRTYACDHHFFDVIDTEAKAYWLGFLAADGCVTIHNRVTLSLAVRDEGHVAKFRTALGSEHSLVRFIQGEGSFGAGRQGVRLTIASPELCSALARHGVVPRKSLTAEPATLAPELMRHYWRGVFDGDGGTWKNAKGDWVAFIVGSRPMVDAFAALAVERAGARACVRAKWCVFEYRVSGNRAVPRLLAYLYDGATVFLDRKHALYRAAMAHREAR